MEAACWMLLLLATAFLLNPSFIHGTDITARKLDKPPKGTIKTIKWDNGDIFDCVDIHKQPAFEHPNLKNHKLQMEPSSYPFGVKVKSMPDDKLGPWHKSGKCPKGSIPIIRHIKTGLPIIRKNSTFGRPTSYSISHQYAVIEYIAQSQKIKGAQAIIDIWDPSLANPQGDFSLTQIWYIAGSGSDLNTAEAGWQVFPKRTGDSQPRLFVYWTADAYSSTGCYDLNCPGFVQISDHYTPGMALTPSTHSGHQNKLGLLINKVYPARTDDSQPTPFAYWTADAYSSTNCYDLKCLGFVQISGQYTHGKASTPSMDNGQQNELGLVIIKDSSTGNIWLYVDETAMGYWPNSIYNTLQQGADRVDWGGEILDSSGSGGLHTLTQMGSGYLPSAGYGLSSYIRNLLYIEDTQNWVAVTANALYGIAQVPNCYNYTLESGQDDTPWLFYGGPGCN